MEVKAKIGKPLGNTPANNKRALAVKRPAHDVRKDEGKSFARLELKATEMRFLRPIPEPQVTEPELLQENKNAIVGNKILHCGKLIRSFDESHPISVSGDARYNNRLESGVEKTPFQPATQKCVLHF